MVVLDIAGTFDRVWHSSLLVKLRAKGVDGSLLMLLKDYLQGRTLRVVLNRRISKPNQIRASVLQGSVLGPVLWNVYVDDLLRQIPAVQAYADDCTISLSYCCPGQPAGRSHCCQQATEGSGGVESSFLERNTDNDNEYYMNIT